MFAMFVPTAHLIMLLLLAPVPSLLAKTVTLPLQKVQRSGNKGLTPPVHHWARRLIQPVNHTAPLTMYEINGGIFVLSVKFGNYVSRIGLDTGSSLSWMTPSNGTYQPTSEGEFLNFEIETSYGEGSATILMYNDTVNAAPGLTLENATFGAVVNDTGFFGLGGLFGAGPGGLAAVENTTSGKTIYIPTLMDVMYREGLIDVKNLALTLQPTAYNTTSGTACWGNVAECTANIPTVQPFIQANPSENPLYTPYFSVKIEAISYGGINLTNSTIDGCIVDSGTSVIVLPQDIFNEYIAMNNATMDEIVGLPRIPLGNIADLKEMTFLFGNNSVPFTYDAQVFPLAAAAYSLPGSVEDYAYLNVGNGGTGGVDCILGMAFQQRVAVLYGLDDGFPTEGPGNISFAQTIFTMSVINTVI